MGQFFIDLVHNQVLIASCVAWLVAQVLKFLISAAINRRFSLERLHGDGGMPSGHSATVMALAITVGFSAGWSSIAFGMCMIFAIIVMHDAMGVRRETGKQAMDIIKIFEAFNDVLAEHDKELKHEKLKTLVGHTPLQVICGAIVGIVVGVLNSIFFIL